MEYRLKECAADDCDWMFIPPAINSRYCNECGYNTKGTHPRVCRAGGTETDWDALLGLAAHALREMGKDLQAERRRRKRSRQTG